MADQPSPGWYPDPAGSGGLRWWDGGRWTDEVHHGTQPPPSLSQLPPPAPEERSPDDDSPKEHAGRDRGGRRRGALLISLSVLVVLVVGGGALAVAMMGPSATAPGHDRLPDLPEPPSIAWTLHTIDQLEELIDEASRYVDENHQWGITGSEVRADASEHLDVGGGLSTWDLDNGDAVLLPSLYEVFGRLQRLDTDTGEIVWTSERLTSPRSTFSMNVACVLGSERRLLCLSRTYDESREGYAGRLRVISLTDGTTVAEEEVGGRAASLTFVADPDEGAFLFNFSERITTVVRYGPNGEVVWERELDGADGGSVSRLQDLLLVTAYTSDGEWSEVLDASTGDREPRVIPPGRRGDRSTRYRDWGGALLRVEQVIVDGRSEVTVARVDEDGQEPWWDTAEALLSTSTIEDGAPILLQDGEGQRAFALDPDDGELLWNYRPRGERVRGLLATNREVVLLDDLELVSVDASTGEVSWARRHALDSVFGQTAIASSMVYLLEDERRLRAIDLDSGENLWSWIVPNGDGPGRLWQLGDRVVFFRGHEIHGLE